MNAKKLTAISLLAAMTALLTSSLTIPIPFTSGYVHFGDSIIYLAAFLLGGPAAGFVGAIGGVIADLLLAPVYALPTCIIKALMGLTVGYIYHKGAKNMLSIFIAYIFGGLIMTVGYYFTDVILYGSFVSPLATLPFNLIQVIGSVPLPCLMLYAMKKRKNAKLV